MKDKEIVGELIVKACEAGNLATKYEHIIKDFNINDVALLKTVVSKDFFDKVNTFTADLEVVVAKLRIKENEYKNKINEIQSHCEHVMRYIESSDAESMFICEDCSFQEIIKR